MYLYEKVSQTHVVRVDPLDLKIAILDEPASRAKFPNLVTSGFQMEQGTATKRPMFPTSDPDLQAKLCKTYPVGILVSDGHIIQNRQPHGRSAGTLIVYKDGKVEVKPVANLLTQTDYKNIQFAVSGCTVLPKVRMMEEGFVGRFSDIGRCTDRPLIGYNPELHKVIIAVRPSTTIQRGQLSLKNLGCTAGITLDAGGSTILRVGGKTLVNTTRRLFSLITW